MHRDSPDIVAHHLDLTRVDPGSDFWTEAAGAVTYGLGRMGGPSRPVEDCMSNTSLGPRSHGRTVVHLDPQPALHDDSWVMS